MTKLRSLMGVLLILHGLAHASAGMWATDIGGKTLVTPLWEIATLGFMAAGAGLIGIEVFHRHWKTLIAISSVSSLVLLLLYGHPLFIVGIAADFTVLGAALILTRVTSPLPPVPKRSAVVKVLLIAIMAYAGSLIALRPWYTSWGTTRSERQMVMIGDPPLGAESHYRIDHAVTVDAPVDSVWPWLAQIGQDRGGFYSYDWLERAFGADIRNADTVVPAWQIRKVGEKVRAVQPTFLGGVFGNDVGWKITELEPGRAIVLENWGAFVVEPIDANSSRLHIRTRGLGVPTIAGIALSPISLLTFEPAHFIMERGMLLGIKKRAEATRPVRKS
jgi:hypothetical protein